MQQDLSTTTEIFDLRATLYLLLEICRILTFLGSYFTLYFLSLHQMTPLHVAFEQGDRIIIMKYLIDKGAEINIRDNNGVNICVTALLTPSRVLYQLKKKKNCTVLALIYGTF